MKVHSIISNTISEESLQTGHLSIRFMADGFSLLLEDKNYRPIILNKFSEEGSVTKTRMLASCEDWLNRHTLIENFKGEVSLLSDSISSVLVPKELFSSQDAPHYLKSFVQLNTAYSVVHSSIKNRPLVIVYQVPDLIVSLQNSFIGKTRILSNAEVLISMSDQINAADHQRGFALIEVQKKSLSILMIKNDAIEISNQLKINQAEDLVYHTLNTLQQLNFDRERSPLFFSGSLDDQELGLLKRYIRKVSPLPYHIQKIDKASTQEHVLLAEAIRCE